MTKELTKRSIGLVLVAAVWMVVVYGVMFGDFRGHEPTKPKHALNPRAIVTGPIVTRTTMEAETFCPKLAMATNSKRPVPHVRKPTVSVAMILLSRRICPSREYLL